MVRVGMRGFSLKPAGIALREENLDGEVLGGETKFSLYILLTLVTILQYTHDYLF